MIALVFTLPVSVRGGEPAYFECGYASWSDPSHGEGTAHVMVDRDREEVVWVAPTPSGWLGRTHYGIVTTTPQEVVARTVREGEALFLRLNVVTGEWLLAMPLDRSQNRNAWDQAGGRMGYPEHVQLYTEVGGTCVVIGSGDPRSPDLLRGAAGGAPTR